MYPDFDTIVEALNCVVEEMGSIDLSEVDSKSFVDECNTDSVAACLEKHLHRLMEKR